MRSGDGPSDTDPQLLSLLAAIYAPYFAAASGQPREHSPTVLLARLRKRLYAPVPCPAITRRPEAQISDQPAEPAVRLPLVVQLESQPDFNGSEDEGEPQSGESRTSGD